MAEGEVVGVAQVGGPNSPSVPNITSPEPALFAPTTDTTGMSETQAAASKWMDEHRIEYMQNPGNTALARQWHDHAAILNGESPDPSAHSTIDENDPLGVADAFKPMAEGDAEKLTLFGQINAGLEPEQAKTLTDVAVSMKLPETVAQTLLSRVGHHQNFDGGFGELTAEQHEELAHEMVAAFGGSEEKARETAALARRYCEHVGGADLLRDIDAIGGTLAYDPKILLSLAGLARAAGLKVQ